MSSLSPLLRLYVTVTVAAGALALAAGIWLTSAPTLAELAAAGVLFVLAWLCHRYPIHLGPKLKVTVEDGATFAAALVLAPPLAMAVAGGAALGFHVNGKTPLYNRLFNASAALLSTGLASVAFHFLSTDGRIAAQQPAILAAAVLAYVVRTELVDGAVALQLRRSPFDAWWLDHRRDIAQLGSLYALGGLAAIVAQDQPSTFFLFVTPVALIFLSFRETTRLRSQTRSAISRLADLIDARDTYTYGHSQRVAEYAERLARRFGMQGSQVELVREAARLHDVGKISTEDRILRKPAALSDAETCEMRKHSEHGYEFLKQLPEFWEGAQLVRLHHERFDGRGYPRSIGGADLPQEASIIAVADAWDAMTSDRPYRRALSFEEGRAELLRYRGSQWDPEVIDAFVAMIDETPGLRAKAGAPLRAKLEGSATG
jgi:putative nucleotidyltransferase with HDIG domain